MCRIIAGLLILTMSALVFSEPSIYRAVYTADYKGLPVSAEGIRQLSRDKNGLYTLSSTATSFFAKIHESSKFQIRDQKILPLEYQYHRSGIGKKRDDILTFDWPNMQALNGQAMGQLADNPAAETDQNTRTNAAQTEKLAIQTGTLDKLLYQLQMREDLLAAQQAGNAKPELSYMVADRDKLKSYRFEVIGTEQTSTPLGMLKTVKISRVRDKKNRKTNLWLAPDYEFMLVRFQQLEENGKGFELLLKQAEFNGRSL
ncbi:MAG: DUF3108 domain-containing protein [Pseudomonadales bacterium]|nr:DUF3108 domain-containing protein [Pseudomonadales bacterium]